MFQLTSVLVLSDFIVFSIVPRLLSVSNHKPHEMHDINNIFTMELVLMVTTGLDILVIKAHKLQNILRTFSIFK